MRGQYIPVLEPSHVPPCLGMHPGLRVAPVNVFASIAEQPTPPTPCNRGILLASQGDLAGAKSLWHANRAVSVNPAVMAKSLSAARVPAGHIPLTDVYTSRRMPARPAMMSEFL